MPGGAEQSKLLWLSLDLQFWKSSSFRCPGACFGHQFGRLCVTLGSLFLDFEAIGKR